MFRNLLDAKETNNKCIAMAWSPQNRAFSNQKHWECPQATSYKKTFVNTDIYLYFDIFRSLCLSWFAHSEFSCWPVKQKQEWKPCSSEERETTLPVCPMQQRQRIQCRSILLILSTKAVLKCLQLNYILFLFFKRVWRVWFLKFPVPT